MDETVNKLRKRIEDSRELRDQKQTDLAKLQEKTASEKDEKEKLIKKLRHDHRQVKQDKEESKEMIIKISTEKQDES